MLKPYLLALKLAGIACAVASIVLLAVSWSARGQQIIALESQQTTIVQAVTAATVEPDEKGRRKLLKVEQVAAAVAGLKRSVDSCLAASVERDRITADAKLRADRADLALANVQTILQGEFSSAEKRIKALQTVKAQPTPDLQCQAIGVDSKAAWEGWK